MAQTISEKIFSKACGKDVKAGDFVLASIDCAMTHDITGPLAVEGFREIVKDKKDRKYGTRIRSLFFLITRYLLIR